MPSFVDHEKPSVGLGGCAERKVLVKPSVMLAGIDEVNAGAELVVLFVSRAPSPCSIIDPTSVEEVVA